MRLLNICSMVAVLIGLLASDTPLCAAQRDSLDRLLDAIERVESRSDPNAVGDHGRALGAYQIHRDYWQDGTRILGVHWKYRDAKDPEKARQVVRAYLNHYGRGKSLLDMARIHNGGPKGDEKESTQEYARKIEAVLTGQTQSS